MAFCPDDYGAAGNGIANDGAIIVATAALGDLYLPPGKVYKIDGHTIDALNGQRIYGGGTLRSTSLAFGLPTEGPNDAPKAIRVLGKTGVKIDGINIEYLGPWGRYYGVTTQDAIDCEITNVDFPGETTACFFWRGTRNAKFIGCRTYGGAFGIATGGDGASGTTDGHVSGLIIADNYFNGAVSEGIDINWDTLKTIIARNHLSNNYGHNEEEIDIGGGNCRDIIVAHNIIDGGGRATIGIGSKLGAKKVKIVGNDLFNFKADVEGAAAIKVSYGSNDGDIDGNTIYGCRTGILITAGNGDAGPYDWRIRGNAINNYTMFGFHGDGRSSRPLNDISLIGGTMDGALTGADGMLVEHTTDFRGIGLRLKRNVRGARFGAGMSGVFTSNDLTGNSSYSLGGTGTNWTPDSIIKDNRV
jgi:hypothetical protein